MHDSHRNGSPRVMAGAQDESKMINSLGASSISEGGSHNGLGSQIVTVPDQSQHKDVPTHLLTHEREILNRQLDIPEVKIGFFGLYQYATTIDLIVLGISTVCAIAGGAIIPLLTVSLWMHFNPRQSFSNSHIRSSSASLRGRSKTSNFKGSRSMAFSAPLAT